MQTEFVYLGHDNSIDLILKSNGVAVALTSVTRMTLTLGAKLIDSDNGDADPIRWIKSGYATGEFRLFLGAETITPANYQGVLIVYDATNPNGVVWGRVPLTVIAEVEANPPPP
jgi:hypothetical protein